MKRMLLSAVVCVALFAIGARAESSLGLGARVFRTVDSLPHQYTEMGMGASVNWRARWTDLFSGQLEMTLYEDGFAGAPQEVVAPQAFVLVGHDIYAGFGAGLLFADGDLADKPFLALRAGIQWPWGKSLTVDLNATYEYGEWDGVTKFVPEEESDTVAIGLGLRLNF